MNKDWQNGNQSIENKGSKGKKIENKKDFKEIN